MSSRQKVRERLRERLAEVPHAPGVYFYRDRLGKVIYIGKAKDLRKRVGSYFVGKDKARKDVNKVDYMVPLIYDIDFITVKSEAEALVLESKLIREWKPRFNVISKDDKRYLLVRVDVDNKMPKFRLVRTRVPGGSVYFGPFVNAIAVREVLREMQMKYGVMLGDAKPELLETGEYRLYQDVRGEIYGHGNVVSEADYNVRVVKAMAFLEGQSMEWMEDVEAKMIKASEKQDYEGAARYRDLLAALRDTLKPRKQFSKRMPKLADGGMSGVKSLREALGMDKDPYVIECFDISHISGTFVVASMIQFMGGKANKKSYRRYKLKGGFGNDDYRAMEEVVGRRYGRLKREGKSMPDLIVIDGGKGQVGAALKGFEEEGIDNIPELVGLAKKHEIVIRVDGSELELERRNEGLRLMMRVRDEAHRFANTFNADLRSKRIEESILDEYEGVGPVKKAAILKHFKGITQLRRATVKEICEVPGIGEKTAKSLWTWLRSS